MAPIKKNEFLAFLASPKALLLGIIIGLGLGVFFKPLSLYFKPLADSYFSLIAMCILPILFTSIIISLTELLRIVSTKILVKTVTCFLGGLLLISAFCTLGGMALKPTLTLKGGEESHIASVMSKVEEYPPAVAATDQKVAPKLTDFLDMIVPNNIFSALVEGLSIKVVIIAILLGIALGNTQTNKTLGFLKLTRTTNEIFNMIFGWLLYLLPITLCFATAAAISASHLEILKASLQIIGLIYLLGIILLAIYFGVIAVITKQSIFKIFRILKEPILLGFLTANYFIPIPSTIKAFKAPSLNLNSSSVELMVPLLATINHHGKILMLAVITIFVARFYGINLNTPELIMALFMATLLGAFAIGQGILLAPIFVLIAKILGIPAEIGILFLVAVTPFISNLQNLVTIAANFTLVTLLAKKEKVPA